MSIWDSLYALLFGRGRQEDDELQRKLSSATLTILSLQDRLGQRDNLVASWQSKALDCQTRLGNAESKSRLLLEEKAKLASNVHDLELALDELTIKSDELATKLDELTANVPTVSTLPDIIRTVAAEAVALPPADRAAAWWEVRKAGWVVFAKSSIQPYEDWPGEKIVAALNAAYDGKDAEHPILPIPELSDATYRVTTIANAKSIFESSYVGLIPYILQIWDCDDFSRELMVHFGQYTLNSCLPVWGDSGWGYHAYNLVVCSDGLAMIEPQMTGREAMVSFYFKVLPEIIGAPGGYWIPRKVRDI